MITSFFERFLVLGFFCSGEAAEATLLPEGVEDFGTALSPIAKFCEDSGEAHWMAVWGGAMVGLGTVSE